MPNPSKLNIGAADCDRSNSRGPHARPAYGSVRQPCQLREAHSFIGMPHAAGSVPTTAGSGTGLVTTLTGLIDVRLGPEGRLNALQFV